MQRKPAFIPISPETDATKLHDEETGITRRRLTNGIPVNYKVCNASLYRISRDTITFALLSI